MRDVNRYGTAASASRLRRDDIAGKTGTTNDSHDAGSPVTVAASSRCRGWVSTSRVRSAIGRPAAARPADVDLLHGQGAAEPAADAHRGAEGVVTVGGEIYFAEFQPGQGVASVGLEDALPGAEPGTTAKVREQIF